MKNGSPFTGRFLAVILVSLILSTNLANAASDKLYAGSRIRFLVHTSPGGSFDATARVLARYLTKYIPGNPSIIVQNIPGGGGRIGANYLFNVAKPDGLTIGHISGFLVLMQMLNEPGVQFDMQRYRWIGGMGIGPLLLTVKPDLPHSQAEQLRGLAKPLRLAATGRSSNSYLYAAVLQEHGGLRLDTIFGYPGAAEAITAIQRGEVDGRVGSYSALLPAIEQGLVRPIVQSSYPTNIPILQNVVVDRQLVRPEGYPLLEALQIPQLIGRAYAAPPNTPPAIVKVLRKAFWEASRDSRVNAELTKMLMLTGPEDFVDGEEVERLLSRIGELPTSVWQAFSRLVQNGK